MRPLAGPRRHVHPRVEERVAGATSYLVERSTRMLQLRHASARSPSSRSRTSRWTTPTCRRSATPWPWPSRRSIRSRVGGLIETAHALLAGLDPSDEMAFALAAGKLWSVHLNDQNGLKFDQDKTFGAANLRAAYNQVRVLELGGYPETGRFVGLDVRPCGRRRPTSATSISPTAARSS